MKLLDLFCGAGGAAMGYHKAGFEVVGVDISSQKHFPFEFVQCDWEEALATIPGAWERAGEQYAIHASPPCQRHSNMTKKWGRSMEHPELIAPVRERLQEIGCEYVIENVMGAPLRNPVMLCGSMFGLGTATHALIRHRLLELSFEAPLFMPQCQHDNRPAIAVYGHAGGYSKRDGIKFCGTDDWRKAMQIDWMSGKELAEAIPPAFTEWVGGWLIRHMRRLSKEHREDSTLALL